MRFKNPLFETNILTKLDLIDQACHRAIQGEFYTVPKVPGRDVPICALKNLPSKKRIGSQEGQARGLHDLANIELQAMELAFRTLIEFPESMSSSMKHQLVEIIFDEARHLKLCIEQIQNLGFQWGSWPIHTVLWDCVCETDSLLDRLFIVHRYLEGSGLDASEKILKRLDQVGDKGTLQVVRTIAEEEISHVQFGSFWYQKICLENKIDSDLDFKERSLRLYQRLPRRLEPINEGLRSQVGFTSSEISTVLSIQKRQSRNRKC